MTRPGTLFRAMAREEYRLHARLFGGRRFAAFPLLVAVLAGVAARALVATGTPFDAVVAGLHALALVFGLQTGTVGLVSTDALDSLLGDVTLLLGSARTLPVTERQLYAVFLVKDVAYYAVLFLAPVALAVGAAGVTAGGDTAALALRAPLLTGTLAATFALGVVGTLALTGLVQRGAAGLVILLVTVAGVALGWSAGVDLVRFTPYAVYRDPTPAGLATDWPHSRWRGRRGGSSSIRVGAGPPGPPAPALPHWPTVSPTTVDWSRARCSNSTGRAAASGRWPSRRPSSPAPRSLSSIWRDGWPAASPHPPSRWDRSWA
jgi:hypothetical protein